MIRILFFCIFPHLVRSATIGFWHFTDFHYDPYYDSARGYPAKYCHFVNDSVGEKLGRFGDERCDNPFVLVQNALTAMAKIDPNPAFLIYTGDSAPHIADSDTNMSTVIDIVNNITRLTEQVFPSKKLYAVLGNHDFVPADQLPTSTNVLYEQVGQVYAPHLGTAAANMFRQYGYYVLNGLDGLRNVWLLGLNTNLFYTPNKLITNETDPGGQFAFMEAQFQQARSSGAKVWLIGHVQPGMRWPRIYQMTDRFNRRLNQLLVANADVIQAMHFGHTHVDAFGLLRDTVRYPPGSSAGAKAWFLTAPGVGTWKGNGRNPAVKYFDVDADSGELRRIRAYYMNISKANREESVTPMWELEYDTKIEGTALDYFVTYYEQLSKNQTSFEEYRRRVDVQSTELPACDSECIRKNLCEISDVDYDAYDRCVVNGSKRVINYVGWRLSIVLLLTWCFSIFVFTLNE